MFSMFHDGEVFYGIVEGITVNMVNTMVDGNGTMMVFPDVPVKVGPVRFMCSVIDSMGSVLAVWQSKVGIAIKFYLRWGRSLRPYPPRAQARTSPAFAPFLSIEDIISRNLFQSLCSYPA